MGLGIRNSDLSVGLQIKNIALTLSLVHVLNFGQSSLMLDRSIEPIELQRSVILRVRIFVADQIACPQI